MKSKNENPIQFSEIEKKLFQEKKTIVKVQGDNYIMKTDDIEMVLISQLVLGIEYNKSQKNVTALLKGYDRYKKYFLGLLLLFIPCIVLSQDDIMKEYYENGNLKSEFCVDFWKKYYKNGNLKESIVFGEDFKLHGSYSSYYETGNLHVECEYKRDLKDGPWYSYDQTGNLLVEGVYKMGLQDGVWREYGNHERGEKSGELKFITSYKSGKRDGLWEIYHNGYTIIHQIYKDDSLITELCRHPDTNNILDCDDYRDLFEK